MVGTSQDPHTPPVTALAPRAGRKRRTLVSSVPIRKSPRLNTEQQAPERLSEARTSHKSSVQGQSRSPASHHRHWLPPNDLIAYSYPEPKEPSTVQVPVLACCIFCRFLPRICSFLANTGTILPKGRTRSSFLRRMTEGPPRAGKQFPQL